MEFSVKDFYAAAENGERVDEKDILNYIRDFKNVILWGAGNLGTAIGSYLNLKNIDYTYWDLRAGELVTHNGAPVTQPFETDFEPNRTLLVICISNNVLHSSIRKKAAENGYKNLLDGMFMYMGLLCPSYIGGPIDTEICMRNESCLSIFCPRLSNLHNFKISKGKGFDNDAILINSVTVIVNQKCNLSCKYCSSYMSNYPAEKRVNIPKQRILEDIHNFFSAVDSVATVTVMGGEPFLHPDIGEISNAVAKQTNVGAVYVGTNNLAPIAADQIHFFKHPKIVVSISHYLNSVPPARHHVFHENIELMKDSGVYYRLRPPMPEWVIPSTLYSLNETTDEMTRKNQVCKGFMRCVQLKNGLLHPCDFSNSLHSLGVADYTSEFVDLSVSDGLKQRIRNFLDAPYYSVCGHCRHGSRSAVAGEGEQGKLDFITLPSGEDPYEYIPQI